MMIKNTIITAILATSTLLVVVSSTSCSGPGMPSVMGLGAGSDSAYINSSRGRRDAVMSESQLKNQRMQRASVSEEIDLERKKNMHRREQFGFATDVIGIFR